ncbi:hypothetical protein RsTz2092_05770 [Deferribacterales bacterium RsTz2092]|nr:hypothetical protein AGMMS49941_05890 [Deferribacterales bacterium]
MVSLFKRLPEWVLSAPVAIRKLIVQEYYVNPKRARYFADNATTLQDIYRLRDEFRICKIIHESAITDLEFYL